MIHLERLRARGTRRVLRRQAAICPAGSSPSAKAPSAATGPRCRAPRVRPSVLGSAVCRNSHRHPVQKNYASESLYHARLHKPRIIFFRHTYRATPRIVSLWPRFPICRPRRVPGGTGARRAADGHSDPGRRPARSWANRWPAALAFTWAAFLGLARRPKAFVLYRKIGTFEAHKRRKAQRRHKSPACKSFVFSGSVRKSLIKLPCQGSALTN